LKKILSVVGARPQFVKAAVLSRLIQGERNVSEVLVHTGQHFDANMSKIFFDELRIPKPSYNLGIHSVGHGAMTGRMMGALEELVNVERPDAFIVYGDTNSTLAGALVAAKLNVPVLHIEAGLRSFNMRMPEEINRVLTDHVSSLLFCPTTDSVKNLQNEGIQRGVMHVGDIMYDATLFAIQKIQSIKGEVLRRYGLSSDNFILSTLHREEATDNLDLLDVVAREIDRISEGKKIIFPIHPRMKPKIGFLQSRIPKALFIDPIGYFEMHALLCQSSMVITDSGGLQKEAYFHRVPCVTMREETEWIETITCGWNRLWKVPEYDDRKDILDYGDGNAGKRILDAIRNKFLDG